MNNKYLEVAIESAKLAGQILKEALGTNFRISNKEGINNLVTEFDLKAEKIIIDNIRKYFPDDEILSEECGNIENSAAKAKWIIDPLDGTVNFAHSIPIFSISIAVEINNEIICGVVYNPMLDEMFYASKGNGAFLNEQRISVSETNELMKSILVTGFPYNVSENPNNCISHFVSIIQKGIPVRRLGSAALDLAYLACGRFDGYWEIKLNPWDVAAGMLILLEAGGKITDYSGKPYYIYDNSILASNGNIHNQLSEILVKKNEA